MNSKTIFFTMSFLLVSFFDSPAMSAETEVIQDNDTDKHTQEQDVKSIKKRLIGEWAEGNKFSSYIFTEDNKMIYKSGSIEQTSTYEIVDKDVIRFSGSEGEMYYLLENDTLYIKRAFVRKNGAVATIKYFREK